jgi:transposase
MVHHSLDYKLSAIKYYKKVNNYVEVCKVFDCNRTSLMRWVKLYDQDKLHSNHNKTRKSYKITEEQVKYIRKIIYQRNNKFISLEEFNKKLKRKFPSYNITSRWLGQVLLDSNITRKRTRKSHFPKTRYGKKISYKKEIKTFFKIIKKYNLDDIISIDETSIQSAMVKEYCKYPKGKRCYFKTTDNKVFRKYTLLMAISTKGVIGYKFYEKGGSNKERFLEFLQENILIKMKNKLLLFDNAKSHTAKIVLDTIIKSGNNYVLNVPYNPDSNPIESYFNQLKHYLKLDSKIEYNDILKSIKKSIKKIKKKHYKNYFLNSLDKSKLKPKKKTIHTVKKKYKKE